MTRDHDDEIAAALAAEAAAHDLPPGAALRLAGRMEAEAGSPRGRGRGLLAAVAVILAIVVIVVAAVNVRDDEVGVVTGDSGTACGSGAARFALTRADPDFTPGASEVAVAGTTLCSTSCERVGCGRRPPPFPRRHPPRRRADDAGLRGTGHDGDSGRSRWPGLIVDSDRRQPLQRPIGAAGRRQIVSSERIPETGTERLMSVPSGWAARRRPFWRSTAVLSKAPQRSPTAGSSRSWPRHHTSPSTQQAMRCGSSTPQTAPRDDARSRTCRTPAPRGTRQATPSSSAHRSQSGSISRVDIVDGTVTPLLEHATQSAARLTAPPPSSWRSGTRASDARFVTGRST